MNSQTDDVPSHLPSWRSGAKWNLKPVLRQLVVPVVIVFCFLCAGFLFRGIMGLNNEVHHLPLAKQHIKPDWLAGDFYYSEDSGYRLLFQNILGRVVVEWGFLKASIAGRLVGYGLLAVAFVGLARMLRFGTVSLLLALSLFLVNPEQGAVAGEWLVGGIEPKVFAYALCLMAIPVLFRGNYPLAAVLLGLATSFHVLVGGWFLVACVTWVVFCGESRIRIRTVLYCTVFYLFWGGFGSLSIYKELTSMVNSVNALDSSYLYVFMRNPHHLNPLSWGSLNWFILFIYSVSFLCAYKMMASIEYYSNNDGSCGNIFNLNKLVLCSMSFFAAGLLVSFGGRSEIFLKYYPFRVGDILLPLAVCFSFVYLMNQKYILKSTSKIKITLIVIIITLYSHNIYANVKAFINIENFPSEDQLASAEWKEMCDWIRHNTAPHSLVVSPPSELESFAWLSERPTLVKFRFVPSSKTGRVDEWYNRLVDLSGGRDLKGFVRRDRDPRAIIAAELDIGYRTLSLEAMMRIMDKYGAKYWVTHAGHAVDLPVVHSNSQYILYKALEPGES